jgi:hypothetical protein
MFGDQFEQVGWEVEGKHWAQVCKQLRGSLKAEAIRSCLGQIASSSLNLSTLTDCADAKSIRNILKLGDKGRPCHFCSGGPELQGALVSRMPGMATCFRASGLDSISAPSDRGKQPVVSPQLSYGFYRPRLQNDK